MYELSCSEEEGLLAYVIAERGVGDRKSRGQRLKGKRGVQDFSTFFSGWEGKKGEGWVRSG